MVRTAGHWFLALLLTPVLTGMGSAAPAREITWYTWPWTAEEQQEWNERLAAFTAQTGIKVNVINLISGTGYEQKLLLLFAAGDVPDVIHLRGQREFPMMGSMHAVLDLTPYLKQTTLPIRDYATSMLRSTQWEGEQIALPSSAGSYLAMYNVDQFNRFGLNPPGIDWTWDDVLFLSRKLTVDRNGDGTPEQYGLFVPDYAWEEMVLSAGIPPLKGDGTFNWNNLTVREMLQFWVDLFTKEKIVNRNWDGFLSGKQAIFLEGTWSIPDREHPPDFTWDTAVMPRWRDLPHGTELIVHGYAIPKAAKNPDDAFRFIEWLASRERILGEFNEGNVSTELVPDRVIMARNLQVLGELAPRLPETLLWTIEHGFQLPRPSWYIGDQNYWSIEYIGQALAGTMSVPTALELTERQFNALVAAGASWTYKPQE
ncbi:MAG TPA: sugar ABC transporter substrate-binding protein [Limnochordia bacterium]